MPAEKLGTVHGSDILTNGKIRGAKTPILRPQIRSLEGTRGYISKIEETKGDRPGLDEKIKYWTKQISVLREENKKGNLSNKEFDHIVGVIIADFEDQAEIDDLTKLYSRKAALNRGEELIAFAERTGEPLSMAIADLDKFKYINDTYGHFAGNAVLRESTNLLRGRVSDVAGRYGGEEIILFLPATNAEESVEALERNRKAMPNKLRKRVKNRGYNIGRPITISAGVITYYPDRETDKCFEDEEFVNSNNTIDPESEAYEIYSHIRNKIRRHNIMGHFVDKADKALFAAKALGRNRIVFSIEDPDGDDLFVDLVTGQIYVHDVELKNGDPVATYDRIE